MIFQCFKWALCFCVIIAAGVLSTPPGNNVFAALAVVPSQGSIPVRISLNNNQKKVIQLLKVGMSKKTRQQLANNIKLQMTTARPFYSSSSGLPEKMDLKMNFPVLDQGIWGSCATFATTAAIDVYLGLRGKDSISQLCNLQLGRTLKVPNASGGWNGSAVNLVLHQMDQYGYLTQGYQQENGCGGLHEYPINASDNGEAMPVDVFMRASNKTNFTVNDWRLLGLFSDVHEASVGEDLLQKVKYALSRHHRVVFSTLLDTKNGAAPVGEFDAVDHDAWLLTNNMSEDIKSGFVAGHAMVITGYDDHACAAFLDANKRKKQCGLLTLRNSWSKAAGDNGNYYMAYNYFDIMALEAFQVGV